MKELDLKRVEEEVARLCMEANYFIGDDVLDKIKSAHKKEKSEIGKKVLEQIILNDEIAAKESVPICQDTGLVVIFLEIGTELKINGDIYSAIQKGVATGYKNGYLRNSVVQHPLDRKNTGDNTPAIIHTKIIAGSDQLKIILAPKGAGSENMSALKMLVPSDGLEGIKKFLLETIKKAGGNPCPPIIVGIGIGGNFEKSALLAKEAVVKNLDEKNPDPISAKLEEEFLELINKTGIGPGGLGGKTTALAVKILCHPCHIASLPVAININCHVARHKEVIL
ncbi:MAG: fumarate hydratase [Fusobacteriaceae bacterium]